jgi:hypothetical protein
LPSRPTLSPRIENLLDPFEDGGYGSTAPLGVGLF